MNRCLFSPGWLIAALICSGCAGAVVRADRYAAAQGFEKAVVEGADFRHVVYRNARAGRVGPALINVYIEGDGAPWILGNYVAKNPTSGDTPMLRLMALDTGPAVYLGRPCYFGLHEDAGCDRKYWSSHRYSTAVADSMAAALARLVPGREVNLLGHSGGGTLAVLLAARVPDVRAVVTLAGNLDTDAWTQGHRYKPLSGSLNPRLQPPLPVSIAQYHAAGGKDKNVDPEVIESFARARPAAVYRLYPEQGHACCWEEVWPEILAIVPQK
jgi:pimeloyl-ACP methyl ester carboxylesterase